MARQDLADRALHNALQTGMAGADGMLTDVARQQPCGPQLVRIAQSFGLLAGQRYHPCFRLVGDLRCLAGPRTVVERRDNPEPQCPSQAAPHSVVRDAHPLTHHRRRWLGAISQQDARTLHPAPVPSEIAPMTPERPDRQLQSTTLPSATVLP